MQKVAFQDESRLSAPGNPGGYYDQHTSPLNETAYRKAIKDGAFPCYRVGKLLLARRVDVHAFIERDEHLIRPIARAAEPEPEGDEIEQLLAAGGVKRRGGRS